MIEILIPTVTAIITLVFACAVMLKESRNLSNRLLSIGALSVLICLTGIIGLQITNSTKMVALWSRLILFAIAIFPPIGIAFCKSFLRTNIAEFQRSGQGVTWLYSIISLFFIILLPGRGIVRNLLLSQNGITFEFTILGKLLILYFIIALIHIAVNLEPIIVTNFQKTTKNVKRVAISYIATLLFLIAAGTQIILGATLPIWIVWIACGLVAMVFVTYGFFEFQKTLEGIYFSSRVVYSSFILLGTGIYFVLLGVSGYFFKNTGSDWGNQLIIFSTIGVFIIFFITLFSTRIKIRIQSFWRRNIYQKKFDFREEWQQFSKKISYNLEIPSISENLVHHVASLFRINEGALYLNTTQDRIYELVAALKKKSNFPQKITLNENYLEIFNVKTGARKNARSLKLDECFDKSLQSIFSSTLPLVVEQELLGILCFGQMEELKQEELELISLFVDQAALAIHNQQLTSKLIEVKALESVHKISSFVIHDLRNHVSILSMLVENSPKYAHRLDFRQNMIDTLEKTVHDMKELISKISISKNKPVQTNAPLSINDLIHNVLTELKTQKSENIKIKEEFSDVPLIFGDKDNFITLVRNLSINAIEAMANGGDITVKTQYFDGSNNGTCKDDTSYKRVELHFADTGTGMAEDFLLNKIFHPFCSTKKEGLGIGLFQCKEIVGSLGGQIHVKSKLGMGTIFTISLPAIEDSYFNKRGRKIACEIKTDIYN